jgi:type VI secretion system protein ImpE
MTGAPASAAGLLRGGDAAGARGLLLAEIKAKPSDARLRIFLFQLSCVLGDWSRALTQLETAAQLDEGARAMEQTYRRVLSGEAERRRVFAGDATPTIFGKPESWVADFVEALRLDAKGEAAAAERLRAAGRDRAAAAPGEIDGEPFEWISDADGRLGPILEIIAKGGYYWLPMQNVSAIAIEAPSDLRDFVWLPARLTLANGGETPCFIPARYPGSESSDDPGIKLARKTEWREVADGVFRGEGQRMLATDASDYALLNVRQVRLAPAALKDA